MQNIEWHRVVEANEPCEKQWESFSKTLNSVLNKHAPMQTFKIHNPKPPPVSRETPDLMKKRRHARETKDPSYHEINKLTKRAIRKDIREDIETRIQNSPSSSLYQQLRHIAPKRGTVRSPENLSSDQLNKYFTDIGTDTRKEVLENFKNSSRAKLNTKLPRVNTGSMQIGPITLDELKRIFSIFYLPYLIKNLK